MKNIIKYLVIPGVLFISLACHRNRLKISEKVLKEEILALEGSLSEKAAATRNSTGTAGRLTKGFFFREDRRIDTSNQPLVIDIAGNISNQVELKLSDIASEITYIRMEPVPDTAIPADLKFRYYLTSGYIIAANLYGIHLYSKEGKYLRPIVKNEMTGVVIKPNGIAFYNDFTLKGGGVNLRSKGDIIYYNYTNTMTGENYILKFDCSSAPLTQDYKFDPENPDRISGLGEIDLDLNHGNSKPPAPRSRQGMFGGDPAWLNYEKKVFAFDDNSYALPSRHNGNELMVIRNAFGDTLSSFTRFEKLVNYTKSLMRGTDDGAYYESRDKLYIRPEYNDTVFRVLPPNRLLPVYILNLGEYKVSKQQGVDPDFDLTGKIIPEEWAETDKFIFLTYTKDNYDCPDNRRKKNVKIYHALYSKQNLNFSVIKGDPFDYSPEILENDIDGGVPVWPSFYMIGKNNEILISLKGKDLKERVTSEHFRHSTAPRDKKLGVEKLAGNVSDQEDILMIIK